MQIGITLSLIGALLALIGYRQRDAIKPETREKLARMWWHYCWGCFSSGMNGAALAVRGTFGVATGAAFLPEKIQAPNPEMALAMFTATFALNAIDWFTKNPLPTNLVETTTTTETTTETKTETLAKLPPIQ